MISFVAVVMAVILAGLAPTPTAVINQRRLASTTVMQSFAYDARHRTYYVAQCVGPSTSGDLEVTELSSLGRTLGHMRLNGFGHAVNIGVEPSGSRVYLWTEAEPKIVTTAKMPHAVRVTLGAAPRIAFGTAIARVPWRNGATVTSKTRGVTVYRVATGSTQLTPSVDMTDGTITVRYLNRDDAYRYRTYKLAAFKKHRYTPIWSATEPAPASVLQGWTEHARMFWRLEGESYSATNRPPGDAGLTQFTGAGAVWRTRITAGSSLSYREPEGMGVVGSRVCYGFASGPTGARRANIYC